jgi:hypothetical protein
MYLCTDLRHELCSTTQRVILPASNLFFPTVLVLLSISVRVRLVTLLAFDGKNISSCGPTDRRRWRKGSIYAVRSIRWDIAEVWMPKENLAECESC